jgi:hypothetical protein
MVFWSSSEPFWLVDHVEELLYGDDTFSYRDRAESKGGVATANKFANTTAAKRVILKCWKTQILQLTRIVSVIVG